MPLKKLGNKVKITAARLTRNFKPHFSVNDPETGQNHFKVILKSKSLNSFFQNQNQKSKSLSSFFQNQNH